MVKFKRSVLARGKNILLVKTQKNSCQIFSPANLSSINKNSFTKIKSNKFLENNVKSHQNLDLFAENQNRQFFYDLCCFVFNLENSISKYKTLKLLGSSYSIKATLQYNTVNKNKLSSDLKLFYFYNFSFLLKGYLNLLNSKPNTITVVNPKNFISFTAAIKNSRTPFNHFKPNAWTLRRVFRKLQAVNILVGGSLSTNISALLSWSSYKQLPVSYNNLTETQYLYYLRRFLDKAETINLPGTINESKIYNELLSLLFTHKSYKYQLLNLKNILRRPLRRRTSRWALLPRSFIKEKIQDQDFSNNLTSSANLKSGDTI